MASRQPTLRVLSAALGTSAVVAMGIITVACGSSEDSEPTITRTPSPVRETVAPGNSFAPTESATSQNPPTGVEPGDQSTPRTPTGDVDPPGGPAGLPGGDN